MKNKIIEMTKNVEKTAVAPKKRVSKKIENENGYTPLFMDSVKILESRKTDIAGNVIPATPLKEEKTAVKNTATKKRTPKKTAVKKTAVKAVKAVKKTVKTVTKKAEEKAEKEFPESVTFNDVTFTKVSNLEYADFRKETEKENGRKLYIGVSLETISDYKNEIDPRAFTKNISIPHNIDILTPIFFGDLIKRVMTVSIYTESMWEFTPEDFEFYTQQNAKFCIYEEK